MAKNTKAVGEALRSGYKAPKVCPPATKDIHINLKNRNHAIEDYGYGPLNPKEPSDDFWKKKAKMWGTSVEEVKTALCRNCAAFVQTKQMLDCIKSGIAFSEDEPADVKALEEKYAVAVQDAANLGYCQLFHFKCAGDRTCDAWLMGGPITDL
jgi:hypothetical protein